MRQTLSALLLLLANVPAVIVSAILYTNTKDIFEVVVINDSAEAITRLDVGLDRRPKQPFGSVAPGTTERFRPATAIGEGSVDGRAVFPSGETTFEITSYVELGSNGPEQHVVRFVTPATQPTVKRKR